MHCIVQQWLDARKITFTNSKVVEVLEHLRFEYMTPGYLMVIMHTYGTWPSQIISRIMTALEYHKGAFGFF